MKSIKEKSEEHLNSVYAGYDNVLKILVKEGFESGANYVLEEIEKFADYTWGVKSLNTISLKKKIKELKGE